MRLATAPDDRPLHEGTAVAMPGSARGTYVLLLDLGRPFESVIGRLGVVSLAPGRYAYVGSAHGPGGLAARLGRHLRRPERVHWHVDHLRDTATPAGWLWAEGEMRLECRWAQALLALAGGAAPVRGFGASDCAQGCAAHLVLLPSGARENDVLAALDAATPGGIVVRRSILGG